MTTVGLFLDRRTPVRAAVAPPPAPAARPSSPAAPVQGRRRFDAYPDYDAIVERCHAHAHAGLAGQLRRLLGQRGGA